MLALKRDPQKGMSVAMVALCIVVLFAMAALAVDLGVLFTARTSAQHAADAAALAGAFTFIAPPNAPQPSSAQNAAVATAAANKILGTSVAITSGNVVVDTATRRVTVTVPRTAAGGNAIGTFFAGIFGSGNNKADVVAKATAEAGQQGSASRCMKPIFVPNTILADPNLPGTFPQNACNAKQLIFDSSGSITAFATTKLGNQVSIRPVAPQKALEPSQFYSLDFGSGGSTYRCAWGQCLNYCGGTAEIGCGDNLPVETGNMNGPTTQGVRNLIDSPHQDKWISIGNYQTDAGASLVTSKSLVVAPVWDDCSQTINPGTNGQKVKVIGFLELFVDGLSGQATVNAHIVGPIACPRNGGGGGGAGNPNPSTGPYATPVRLIQTQ